MLKDTTALITVSDRFYHHLFRRLPRAREMFSSELNKSVMFANMLILITTLSEHDSNNRDHIQLLAKKHREYGVDEEMFVQGYFALSDALDEYGDALPDTQKALFLEEALSVLNLLRGEARREPA